MTLSIPDMLVPIAIIIALIYVYYKTKNIEKMAISLVKNAVEYGEAKIKADVEAWINSEQGQKALYGIGALVAVGAKDNLGLSKRGGKHGLEGLLMEIAGNFIQNKMMGQNQQTGNSDIAQ